MLPENIFPKKLSILIGIFVVVIIIGLLLMQKPGLIFTVSPDDAIQQMVRRSSMMSAELANQAINKNDPQFIFIDTRDPYEFVKGHIKGAENIPVQDLLNKTSLKMFRDKLNDSVRVVLYGNDESAVNGAVQILRQSGYSNLMALEGGYPCYLLARQGMKTDTMKRYKAEARWYDYKSFINQSIPSEKSSTQNTPVKTISPVKNNQKPSKSHGEGC